MTTNLEDIIAAALVQRGGLQIGLEPQQSIDGELVGTEVNMALVHPDAGRLEHPGYCQMVEELGLGTLAFCRCMVKVLAFQQELKLLSRDMICTVAAPLELLHDAKQLERTIRWLIGRKLRPSDIRLRFCLRDLPALHEQLIQGMKTIVDSGFGVALDAKDMDTGFGAMVQEMCHATVIADRTVVAQLTASPQSSHGLAARLSALAASGAEMVASGVDDEQSRRQAIAAGFKVLQGRHFPFPAYVAQALQTANAQ